MLIQVKSTKRITCSLTKAAVRVRNIYWPRSFPADALFRMRARIVKAAIIISYYRNCRADYYRRRSGYAVEADATSIIQQGNDRGAPPCNSCHGVAIIEFRKSLLRGRHWSQIPTTPLPLSRNKAFRKSLAEIERNSPFPQLTPSSHISSRAQQYCAVDPSRRCSLADANWLCPGTAAISVMPSRSTHLRVLRRLSPVDRVPDPRPRAAPDCRSPASKPPDRWR